MGGRGSGSRMISSSTGSGSTASNQSERIRWAARNGAENNSQYKLSYTETISGSTWKMEGSPKGPKSERGSAGAEIVPNTDGGYTVSRWAKSGDQLEKRKFKSLGPALQTAKTYLRSGWKRT